MIVLAWLVIGTWFLVALAVVCLCKTTGRSDQRLERMSQDRRKRT